MNNSQKKTGVYVHIPFCVSKCLYCDFVSYAGRNNLYEAYRDALINEIRGCEELSDAEIKSVFFGGGTPTVFPYLSDIVYELSKYNIADNAEITVESNPGTLSQEVLSTLRVSGVNRLSIGLQAWQNTLLKSLGRIHSAAQFLESYNIAVASGYKNINVDLMFSIPGQKTEDWCETLEKVTELEPAHISAYSLIIEDNTVFGRLYNEGTLVPMDEDTDREMYSLLKDFLAGKGYNQYEISNFCKAGNGKDYRCRHNVMYWERGDYLGFGAGAHSFYDGVRYNNTADLDEYLIKRGDRRKTTENTARLSRNEAIEEFMFLGLRMTRGISADKFRSVFGVNIYDIYGNTINELIRDGLLDSDNGHLYLTARGIDVSNRVFISFLF